MWCNCYTIINILIYFFYLLSIFFVDKKSCILLWTSYFIFVYVYLLNRYIAFAEHNSLNKGKL